MWFWSEDDRLCHRGVFANALQLKHHSPQIIMKKQFFIVEISYFWVVARCWKLPLNCVSQIVFCMFLTISFVFSRCRPFPHCRKSNLQQFNVILVPIYSASNGINAGYCFITIISGGKWTTCQNMYLYFRQHIWTTLKVQSAFLTV